MGLVQSTTMMIRCQAQAQAQAVSRWKRTSNEAETCLRGGRKKVGGVGLFFYFRMDDARRSVGGALAGLRER